MTAIADWQITVHVSHFLEKRIKNANEVGMNV